MSNATDIARILEQERRLVFPRFNEADAFAIGCAIKAALENAGKGALVDIRLWDRPLFFCAIAGATADNADWARRKVNVVQRFQTSSYRKALEMADAGKVFERGRGTDPKDYATAGGGFPIAMKDGPIIGCITVSGLPQRDDHRVVVEAIARHLGMDLAGLALD
ncbi:MAG: heme-degrading domain-containing protein [Rhizobiaceae bacterium]